MLFSCTQALLAGGLHTASRAVAHRPSQPILGNVLLVADREEGAVAVTGFDLHLGIEFRFSANVSRGGSITLPSRLLNDIVSRLPDGDVAVEVDLDRATATLLCGSGRYEMRGLPAEEFPALPQIAHGRACPMPVEALLAGLNGSLFAASTDETKQVLTGVHIQVNGAGLEFAATNGHRLAVVEIPCTIDGDMEVAVTVPARALRELERMLNQYGEGMIAVQFDHTHMVFQGAQQILTARLLDGMYPNYRRLIPTEFKYAVAVERKALISTLDRLAVLADQRNNIVKITIDEGNQAITLSVDESEFGAGEESLPAQVTGGDFTVAFNVKYLLDGLKAINTRDVSISLISATAPAVIAPIGGAKLTYLVMPVQIKN